MVVQENLLTTAYKYSGRLDYDTGYFWQVTATKPLPSEPSPVFSFTTVPEPAAPQDSAPVYSQLLNWLQISVLVNILGFVVILGMMIIFRNHRM
jgi:hypothetical protein